MRRIVIENAFGKDVVVMGAISADVPELPDDEETNGGIVAKKKRYTICCDQSIIVNAEYGQDLLFTAQPNFAGVLKANNKSNYNCVLGRKDGNGKVSTVDCNGRPRPVFGDKVYLSRPRENPVEVAIEQFVEQNKTNWWLLIIVIIIVTAVIIATVLYFARKPSKVIEGQGEEIETTVHPVDYAENITI